MLPLRAMQQQQHAFGIVEGTTAAIIAATAASVIAGTTTALVSSRQAQATADYNQNVAEQQAELARRAGKAAEADTREQNARAMALQRAQLADSGITQEGTPLLLLLDSASQAEVEAQRARYTGKVNEQGAVTNAQLFRQQGEQAATRGAVGIGTTLLTGAANAGTSYAKYGSSVYTPPKGGYMP